MISNVAETSMSHEGAAIIRVNVRQESGFLYANSVDLLGLHVCGNSFEQVCERVVKTIKAIFRHGRGIEVEVLPASADVESFPLPKPNCERFVVHRAMQ